MTDEKGRPGLNATGVQLCSVNVTVTGNDNWKVVTGKVVKG